MKVGSTCEEPLRFLWFQRLAKVEMKTWVAELAWFHTTRCHLNTHTGPLNAVWGQSFYNTRQKYPGTRGEGFVWGYFWQIWLHNVLFEIHSAPFVLPPTASICEGLHSKLGLLVNKLSPVIIWVSGFFLVSGSLGPDFHCFQRGYGPNRNDNKLSPFTQMKNWWHIKGRRGTSNPLCSLEKWVRA